MGVVAFMPTVSSLQNRFIQPYRMLFSHSLTGQAIRSGDSAVQRPALSGVVWLVSLHKILVMTIVTLLFAMLDSLEPTWLLTLIYRYSRWQALPNACYRYRACTCPLSVTLVLRYELVVTKYP